MSGSAGTSPDMNTSCHRKMPFEPSCDFEREVYQQWLAAQPSSRQSVTPGCQEYDRRNSHDHCPANATISRVDSGIDVWDDQCSGSQEGPQRQQQPVSQNQNNNDTDQELSSHSECPNPEACELSPEMSITMRRFSVQHNCVYAEAKKQLVDKIVHRVMDNAAPRIMALLQEELQRRANEINWQDDEESKRTDREGEFSPKM